LNADGGARRVHGLHRVLHLDYAKNTSWERKCYEFRKKLSKKLLFDSLLMKIWAKLWKNIDFLRKSENYGNQKWWICGFVKMIFEGSTGVSLKWSGRRSTAVDEIYTLIVLQWRCSCWIDVKFNPGVCFFLYWFLHDLDVTKTNAKNIQFFALCWFQNLFSYVFGTFWPSNSIFVDK
jgi:hypothetical protein